MLPGKWKENVVLLSDICAARLGTTTSLKSKNLTILERSDLRRERHSDHHRASPQPHRAMDYKVILSDLLLSDLQEIVEYLEGSEARNVIPGWSGF
jgi:hypothetical protein